MLVVLQGLDRLRVGFDLSRCERRAEVGLFDGDQLLTGVVAVAGLDETALVAAVEVDVVL
jgi:hypothetical protein